MGDVVYGFSSRPAKTKMINENGLFLPRGGKVVHWGHSAVNNDHPESAALNKELSDFYIPFFVSKKISEIF